MWVYCEKFGCIEYVEFVVGWYVLMWECEFVDELYYFLDIECVVLFLYC